MSEPAIVVVGAGQGGLQAAESLRSEGYDGPLYLIGDEPFAPYNRPPLSKAFLLGETDVERLTIRGPEALARKNIDLVTGVAVTAIDRGARIVRLSDGRSLPYRGVVLATGARVRPLTLPGHELAGIHYVRTLEDAQRLGAELPAARAVAVIGGGFIGLEAAAVARKKGHAVTVFEAADRLMARVVSPALSAYYADLHRRHGVDVRLGAQVARLRGDAAGRVSGVELGDGTVVPADLVIAGIGVLPNVELAEAAGLACEGGVLVDDCARTEDAAIVAIGDCAARRDPAGGRAVRLESVQNAVEQAKAGAAALMGHDKPFHAAPWFWSDQYDVKLQMVGSSAGHDRAVERGVRGEDKFSIFYFRDGRLIGIDSLNRAQDHMVGRRLLDRRIPLTPDQAADPAVDLTKLQAPAG